MKHLILLVLLLSCSTIRVQVKAPYKSSKGNGFVTYERSYDVGGGMPLWCGLSAIYFGGACWAYLGMPYVPLEERSTKDALTVLNTKLESTDAILEAPVVKRVGWSSAETYFSLDDQNSR